MSTDNLRLDHQLCFALFSATNAIVRSYEDRLAELGLSYVEYLVMIVLWERETVSLEGLVEALRLPRHELAAVVSHLQEKGLAHREALDDDVIGLAGAGERLRDAVASIQHSVAWCTGLDSTEFGRLRKTLETLTETILHRHARSP